MSLKPFRAYEDACVQPEDAHNCSADLPLYSSSDVALFRLPGVPVLGFGCQNQRNVPSNANRGPRTHYFFHGSRTTCRLSLYLLRSESTLVVDHTVMILF